jgi:Calcium-dependent channel, 7TM region, putative phosphate
MRVLFFALCPQIFKALSNFGSGAASIHMAEKRAIRYYWFFMLVTAFTGTSLATVVYEGVVASLDVGGTLKDVLRSVASTVPTTVSAQWLSWIIFRTGITLPYNYLLQFNNFLYSSVGFNCCARATTGG